MDNAHRTPQDAVTQVTNEGRMGYLTNTDDPAALPYLYAVQRELSDWMLGCAKQIAYLEAKRDGQENAL